MKTYTIPQKMSNTGSIHDIESDCSDREIKFPKGHKYAVVLAAYYGGKGYTVHRDEAGVIRQLKHLGEYSLKIIDSDGNEYDNYYGQELRRR